ncbi:MAG: VCBS repeat-containing protein [Rhodobacterales bacterium]|nr:VCBS repeat-containing protein [Rhodobacterales bacterium]
MVNGPSHQDGAPLPWPIEARLSDPTDRYPHNVLGRIPSFTTLTVTAEVCSACAAPQVSAALTLSAPLVFEDVAPRLWDVTGDGRPEVVVVQSHEKLGARLTVWELRDEPASGTALFRMIAATDFIGTRFRWLAPVGYGDFTDDGHIEIAYVETPHLGKTLRLVGLEGDRLADRAALSGVTNHRIGEEDIAGGVRVCDGRAEAVLATADWRRIVAVAWEDGTLVRRDLGALTGPQDWARALACPD